MKQFKIFVSIMLMALVGFTSCEKMMYVESDRYLYVDNNTLDSPNDSVYSLAGILSKMQLLGDQYVLLGELRAELMDVTHNANQDMIDLSNLEYHADNEFLNLTNYYAAINNCNYLIQNMDSSVLVQGETRLKREVVAAKSIRAWVYMQLALNYNGAFYYEHPILTIPESQEVSSNEERYFLSKDDIFAALEADLLPYVNYPMPEYGALGADKVSYLIPSIRYLLGEIYLWQNRYQEAADMYMQDIIQNTKCVPKKNSSSYLEQPNLVFNEAFSNSFKEGFSFNNTWSQGFYLTEGVTPEITCGIAYYSNNNFGRFNQSKLYKYTYTDYMLAPSEYAFDWFMSQPYRDQTVDEKGTRHNVVTTGDLRGLPGSIQYLTSNIKANNYADEETRKIMENMPISHEPIGSKMISTYRANLTDLIILQRSTMAYLRYAEAINRAGKPTVALAVINNGLNSVTLKDSMIIAPSEMDTVYANQWANEAFLTNAGTRTRGQGPSTRVRFVFDKPDEDVKKIDSILFVEQVLVDECGLESAFQGNRFHDLLRFTQHDDAPNYIGNALAKKHPERAAEFQAKGKDDWYIPYPTTQE